MCWDDSIDEEMYIVCHYQMNTPNQNEKHDCWVDANQYIGKARYYEIELNKLLKHIYGKENVDLFCKNNPECYGLEFNIYGFEPNGQYDGLVKYIPKQE